MGDDGDRSFAIGELAEACGRSVDTLRYYESEGLIPNVARNAAGHRRYLPEHVEWMRLLDRLRASGMPIAWMRRYAELVEAGSDTLGARRKLLRRHARNVETRIESLEECLGLVRAKIEFYEELEEDAAAVWRVPG